LLLGVAAAGGVVAAGAAGVALLPGSVTNRLGLGPDPDPYIPDAPEGEIRLETVRSEARGQDVQLFTAVPAGHGDGAGLPVVIVLHGATGRPADYQGFGLGRFLTAAVQAGTPPFVLAGADGGLSRWEPAGTDDPQAMVVEEMPDWLAERGFDADRRAVWGWSMGGYGAARLAEEYPDWARAAALFSPAVAPGDAAFAEVDRLAGLPLSVCCGEQDRLYENVRAFVDALPTDPEMVTYGDGRHTRVYWNDQTLDAFAFLGRHLGPAHGLNGWVLGPRSSPR
jgi:S-formylglutathione hydrolase FrmB